MKDVSQFAVRQNKCYTCPFIMTNGKYRDSQLVSRLQIQVLTEASHICHHQSLKGEKANYMCKGAKDYQAEILGRMNLIKEDQS